MVFQITACFITVIDFDYIAPNPTGEEDTVLTLSTCTPGGASRFIVMAKLVEVNNEAD